jgi:hypothetical protein
MVLTINRRSLSPMSTAYDKIYTHKKINDFIPIRRIIPNLRASTKKKDPFELLKIKRQHSKDMIRVQK